MLGARIDVVEASIWHFNAYLLFLPEKNDHPLSAGRPIWVRPLKLTFSNNSRGPGQWVTLYMQVKSEFLQLLLKKQAYRLHS